MAVNCLLHDAGRKLVSASIFARELASRTP